MEWLQPAPQHTVKIPRGFSLCEVVPSVNALRAASTTRSPSLGCSERKAELLLVLLNLKVTSYATNSDFFKPLKYLSLLTRRNVGSALLILLNPANDLFLPRIIKRRKEILVYAKKQEK